MHGIGKTREGKMVKQMWGQVKEGVMEQCEAVAKDAEKHELEDRQEKGRIEKTQMQER